MIILSIETSCDETGISLIEAKGKQFKVIANELASQAALHAEYGGVYPNLAKREHIKNLPMLFQKILKNSNLEEKDIELITVTHGPGLEPALWTGIKFAEGIRERLNIPIVPTNHMEGHVLSVFAKNEGEFSIPRVEFPALSLLVSGGHTEIVLVKSWTEYEILGRTLDDAVGEAFDKVARMLELPYPGGPHISSLAEKHRARTIPKKEESRVNISLPRPMLHSGNYNFSYSGLKTAVLYLIRDLKKDNPDILKNTETREDIACEFESAAIEVLIEKTKKAIKEYGVNTLVVDGGVAANKHLREEIKNQIDVSELLLPEKELTGDNSIMIALAGYFNFIKNKKSYPLNLEIKAQGNLKLK